jgi:hypothetical protein
MKHFFALEELIYKSRLAKKFILRKLIEEVMSLNPGYGYRRVALALNMNHKRAKRVMKNSIESLHGEQKRPKNQMILERHNRIILIFCRNYPPSHA